ncbi:hypothetical protein LZ318_35190 [Saccharopolyspora indica]|uniref:hypothetical protein n=1 Tax=Saccharopolyspora indica TaxID=1229659 RepID=UPI0022EA67C0|nr:hypothetical protein [Saccharopolyspora indica]MDA3649832.1 hypothetical protein [Saccharopolyspora indica]
MARRVKRTRRRAWMEKSGVQPEPSMVGSLPDEWLVTGSDDGAFFVLGGALAGDPDVLIRVEQATGGGRDLTEPASWLVAELLAAVTGGTAMDAELTEDERSDLSSRLRMLMRTGRADG